jgi:hypothetical protein
MRILRETDDFVLGQSGDALELFDYWSKETTTYPLALNAFEPEIRRMVLHVSTAYYAIPNIWARFRGADPTNPVILVAIGIALPQVVGVFTDKPAALNLRVAPRHTTVFFGHLSVAVAHSPWAVARRLTEACHGDPMGALAAWDAEQEARVEDMRVKGPGGLRLSEVPPDE